MPTNTHTSLWVTLALLLVTAGCRTVSPPDARIVGRTASGETCESCHAQAYARAPFDHASVGYGTDCARCHTEADWAPTFEVDHTAFALANAHAALSCRDCHAPGRPDPQPKRCLGCHAADKARAVPSHATYPDDCAACHKGARWKPAQFDHAVFFVIDGKHVGVACEACHVGGRYENTPTACVGCHADDRPAEPDHSVLPEACQACHTTAGWKPAHLDHDQFWPLTGRHTAVDCADCHPGGRYSGTPTACVGCHADDRPAEPDHTRLPEACDACHTTAAWTPARLDHAQFWPLAGKHADAPCEGCHAGGRYAGTPKTCISCHAADKAGAHQPEHAGFPDDCAQCHTAAGWSPAQFDHASFPLQGRHAQLGCDACHAGGRYAGTPRTCVGCHADDRAGASPSHAGYPDDCTQCHTQNAWSPASFRHRFPVPHHDARTCGNCHLNQADYGDVSCIHCHAHTRAQTDGHHGEVGGYQYTSAGCIRCHPTGNGGD